MKKRAQDPSTKRLLRLEGAVARELALPRGHQVAIRPVMLPSARAPVMTYWVAEIFRPGEDVAFTKLLVERRLDGIDLHDAADVVVRRIVALLKDDVEKLHAQRLAESLQ